MRQAHIRDAVAVCKFQHWMEQEILERYKYSTMLPHPIIHFVYVSILVPTEKPNIQKLP
jgi:hypothetical protein